MKGLTNLLGGLFDAGRDDDTWNVPADPNPGSFPQGVLTSSAWEGWWHQAPGPETQH